MRFSALCLIWADFDGQNCGGRGGIRTHEGVAPLAVFKTAALNHSATLPSNKIKQLKGRATCARLGDPTGLPPAVRKIRHPCSYSIRRFANVTSMICAALVLGSSCQMRCTAFAFVIINSAHRPMTWLAPIGVLPRDNRGQAVVALTATRREFGQPGTMLLACWLRHGWLIHVDRFKPTCF